MEVDAPDLTTEEAPLPVLVRRPPRRRYWVAGGLCFAAVVALLVGGLSRNIVYFKTVSEEHANPSSGRVRIMGGVVPGSVHRTATGVAFVMTEGGEKAKVLHRGDPPELFKDGAPVVCEGRWGADGTFDSDRIMIKHGSDYRPPPANDKSKPPANS